MITLTRHSIKTKISQRYASIEYCYNFHNNNSNAESSELKFEITIDPSAFVSHFVADIDGEMFYGQTKQKEEAKQEYNKAKKEHQNAILISQPYKDISNVFQIKTNMNQNSKTVLMITIEQYLTKQFHFNQLYIQILRNFDKYNIVPIFTHIPLAFDINEASGIYSVIIPTSSNTSSFTQKMNNSSTHCSISGKLDANDSSINELMLKYKIKGEQNDSTFIYDDKSHTFCHIISDIISDSKIEPQHETENEGAAVDDVDITSAALIPRRVMFVIDKSGSMTGGKWNKTIEATAIALRQLRAHCDRFGIIFFNGSVQQHIIVLANEASINDSINTLHNENAQGSTNINDALLYAIQLIQSDIALLNDSDACGNNHNFYTNQIIFITDGEPNSGETNTKRIISNIKKANDLRDVDKYSNKISIFSFGVGSDGNDSGWIRDLNHSFLKALSLNNNGVYTRIKQTQVDTALTEYYNMLSTPILCNIRIEYDHVSVINLTETAFNTLYAGNDLIVCGQMDRKQNDADSTDTDEKYDNMNITATVSAVTGKEIKNDSNELMMIKPVYIRKKINIELDNEDDCNRSNIERIWAYLKLQQFAEDELELAEEDDTTNDEQKANTNTNIKPLSLATKYKFVTPWTSMIVVKGKRQIFECKDKEYGDMMEGEHHEQKMKLVMVGDSNCGKTSLMLRFMENVFSFNHSEVTLDVNCKNKKLKIDDDYFNVTLWDTVGTERYSKHLPSIYLRNTNGIIFVCDINNIESIRNIQKWAESIQETIDFDSSNAIILVNKSDLIENENEAAAMDVIKELTHNLGIDYIVSSAKENVNVKSSFYKLIGSVYDSMFVDAPDEEHYHMQSNVFAAHSPNVQLLSVSHDFYQSSARSKSACC